MDPNTVGNSWQDAYIAELVDMLGRILAVIDECPEMWGPMERAGIPLRARVGS